MLTKLTVENYKSFDKREELSMISSSKIQGNKDHRVKIKQTNILKHAVIYGANASGKSNLVATFDFIKKTLLEGLPIDSINDFCRNREENKTRDSFFELQFTVEDKFYAYGFSVRLNRQIITEEWLYELMQDGTAHEVFTREGKQAPRLGEKINLSDSEKSRFDVYSADFIEHENQLFLSEMSRGKRYDRTSKLVVLQQVFNWLINNIIVIRPNVGISNTESYYNDESLDNISRLIRTFDTGITEIKTRIISLEELEKKIPAQILSGILSHLKRQLQITTAKGIQMTWRIEDGFYNIRIHEDNEPEITTLVMKHGQSVFDFSFAEESDGTKRLFDLIDMLLTDRPDTLFVVDELERSLHPKLTERFLQLFMEAHENSRMQIIFTTHEASIMDQKLFRRDEIWFVERDSNNASNLYSLDRFKERYDKVLSKAYLEGRYGAIPVFNSFSFRDGE